MRGMRFQIPACHSVCRRSIVKTHARSVPHFGVGLAIALAVVAPNFLRAGEPGGECPAEFPVVMHPENLDCPYHGFIIRGVVEGGGAGYSVASAGDINNDGIDDLIIGTGSTYPTYWWGTGGSPPGIGAGEAYVIFGDPDWNSLATFDLADLDGTNGFKFVGFASNERFGLVVARAGDINNDGIDDLLISDAEGAPAGDVYIGHTYVVFGVTDIGSKGVIDLAGLDGTNGFVVRGFLSGHSVSAAGDINEDGVDDFLIGAPTKPFSNDDEHPGRAYLVFGGAGDWPAVVELSDLAGSTEINGTNGLAIQARPEVTYNTGGPYASLPVAGLGDVNVDGFDDLIVGAPGGHSPFLSSGEFYVIFGGAGDWPAVVSATALAGNTGVNGTNGFIAEGPSPHKLGQAVSAGGDVNNDGINDFLIGAPAAPNSVSWLGRGFVLFGSADLGGQGQFDLERIDGSNGFMIDGFLDGPEEHLLLGSSLSAGGDLNGDGFDDVLLGTAGLVIGVPVNGEQLHLRDEAFVVFGGPGVGEGGSIVVSELNGSDGFKFEGSEEPYGRSETSRSVASAGDLNADGFDDIVIGAPGAGKAGEAYVLWGCPQLGGSDCNDNHIADACETDCNGNGIPDECECLADLDSDGAVGPFDLALLLGNWDAGGDPADCPAEGDLNGDGTVGPLDLAMLLGNWGPCE